MRKSTIILVTAILAVVTVAWLAGAARSPHGGGARPAPVAATVTPSPTPSPYPSAATLNERCLDNSERYRFAPELCEEAPDGAALILAKATKAPVWYKVPPVACDAAEVNGNTITTCDDGGVTTSPSASWATVSANARAVGFKPFPDVEEFHHCLWLVGDTSVIICPDGRVETS